jgi:polyisoprenoid-binding protein YceI
MKNFITRIASLSFIIAVSVFGLIPYQLKAQANYKLSSGKNVSITVLGLSNVHDWTMTSTIMESQCDFKFDGGNLHSIPSLTFSLAANSLKSDHESMDKRTYKTLKADQYPRINYKLTSSVVTSDQKNKYSIKTIGDLTIAGSSQTINMIVTAVVNPDNTITCTGSQKIKLTDYKIDPPSFLLGAMKVKNDLTIQFNLVYTNN